MIYILYAHGKLAVFGEYRESKTGTPTCPIRLRSSAFMPLQPPEAGTAQLDSLHLTYRSGTGSTGCNGIYLRLYSFFDSLGVLGGSMVELIGVYRRPSAAILEG